MSRKDLFTGTRVVAVLFSVAAMGALASPALAVNAGEPVAGTTLSSLSLTAGAGAVLNPTQFAPGNTATGTGALIAVDTNPAWHLQVEDQAATNPGKMAAATGATCAGSDANLANPLQVSVTSALPGVVPDPAVSLSGSNQEVASASSQLLDAADAFVTHYSQVIPTSEVMLSGCVYSLTATYTLQ
jgi:hypothetical protein